MALSEAEEKWLEGFLVEADDHPRVSPWEKGFIADQVKAFGEFDVSMHLSGKQWSILRRVAVKIGYDQPDAGDME